MKLSRLSIISFIFIGFFSQAIAQQIDEKSPLLALVIMVKNEAEVMLKTLQPFLDAGVDHYLILDTGSTDGTVELTKQIFQDYGVQHGYVVQEPWVDFSTSRNRALECAEQAFPNAVFLMMIDAEWYVQNVDGLLDFCKLHEHTDVKSFLISMKIGEMRNYLDRLWRASAHVRFTGVVHECITIVADGKIPEDIFIVYAPARTGIEQSQRRWQRDRDLLLKEVEKNPQDARSLFYLAQTYSCLGDLQNAKYWYHQRCLLKGWDQEDFMAHYRLACIYEGLDDWPQAMFYYFKAINIRPSRVEPLVRMAQHYYSIGEWAASYLFARASIDEKYNPESNNDVLFLEKSMYDYERYNLLGIAAWYVGQYEIGYHAVQQALKAKPDAWHLNFNLDLYQQKMVQVHA